jgi:hypothetical protein
MGMLGNQIAAGQALTIANDSFNGDGSTVAFTLSQTVGSVNDIEVLVDNVQQSPYDSSYSVSGTTLTFSGAPSTGTNNIYVIYNASKHITTQQVIPDDGSVTHSKFHTNALDPITLDQSNNRVGINTTNGPEALNISGNGNLRFQTTSTVRIEYLNTTGAYALGTTGGAAIGFNRPATGDDEIFFETHNGGVSHAERMRINKDGYVTTPNQPGFSVRQNAQGGIDYSSTDYIAFRNIHTTFFNTGNHFNSSTGMFTAPVAGNYLFGAAVRYDSFTGNYAYGSIYKNSSTLYSRELTSLTGNYLHLSIHCIMNMSANDTCHVALRNSGDSSINLDSDSNFYGYLLG